jgi:hypothetical protein
MDERDNVLIPPPRRFRCSHGHEWVREDWQTTLDWIAFPEHNPDQYCIRCIIQFCRSHFGVVQEVQE